jgi:hypothetical protein
MLQRVPNGISADFSCAIFDVDRHEELGLLKDFEVEQGQIELDLVSFGDVGQFVLALGFDRF